MAPQGRQIGPFGALSLDAGADAPLYDQIAQHIRRRIQEGELLPGARLPPTRTLAQQLGVHRKTVVRAYEELEAQGWVDSTVGRGTFVAQREALPSMARRELPWSALVSEAAKAEPLGRLDRLAPGAIGHDLINLTRMQPSADLVPVEALDQCLRAVLARVGPQALAYAPRDGVLALRELIAARLSERGSPASPHEIMITTGSQQGLDLLARALVTPGDIFLVEGSTYADVLNVLGTTGARVVGVPSDEEGPDLAALERLANPRVKGLYLMPNCHNPTGAAISHARRDALVAWASKHQIPIIEDDFAAEIELGQEPPPASLRARWDQVITLGTFSKKLIPALRVGYLVCPAALLPRLVPLKHAMDLGTSALLQYALAEFIQRGELDTHLRRIRPVYRRRRDALEQGLRQSLPGDITWHQPQRGLALWIPLRDLNPEQVFHEARRAGVLVSPSTLHNVTGAGASGVRLTYCGEAEARLREGGRRLGQVITQLRKQGEHTSALGVV